MYNGKEKQYRLKKVEKKLQKVIKNSHCVPTEFFTIENHKTFADRCFETV